MIFSNEIIKILDDVGENTEVSEYRRKYFDKIDMDTYKWCLREVDDYAINDLSRVLDLCVNNDLAITKIYFTGNILKGFDKKLAEKLDVVVEKVVFHSMDEKEGKGYVLEIDDILFSGAYTNALGLCIYPML